jgi:hypothetical protein
MLDCLNQITGPKSKSTSRFRARLRRDLRLFVFAFLAASATVGLAESAKPPVPEEELVNRYMLATHEQEDSLRGATMEVDIDASVPKLQKHGKLQALKSISRLGKITYHLLGFSGDNSIKTEVIARYLKAEIDAAKGESNVSINPINYKFKYKGMEDWNGRPVYVLHVTPRHKKVGLYKGELWLDAETCMPVREAGSFVKSPSIFLKKMEFVRDYEMENGVSLPQRMESKVQTRFFGPVELSVSFLALSRDSSESADVLRTRTADPLPAAASPDALRPAANVAQ